MRPTREVIREEISALVHLQESGASAAEVHASCLQLIDRVAAWATEAHRQVSPEVLTHLATAMRAAGRKDVAGVIVAVENATALVGRPGQKPAGARRPKSSVKPDSPPPRGGVRPVSATLDPLLAKLQKLAKRKK